MEAYCYNCEDWREVISSMSYAPIDFDECCVCGKVMIYYAPRFDDTLEEGGVFFAEPETR